MDKTFTKNKEPQICRLCLEKLIGIEGNELNLVKIQMLKELTIDLLFEIANDLILCPSCNEKLQQSFIFKITCINNDNVVKAFHNSKEDPPLILEEVFSNQITSDLALKMEETKVCRFCLKHFVVENCTSLDQMDTDIFLQDLISRTVSEVDLSLTMSPVICSACMDALQVLFNFIVGCFDANEIIQNYISSIEQDTAKSINLLKVFDFMSNLKIENENIYNLNNIKAEKEDWNVDIIVCDTTGKQELSKENTISDEVDNKTDCSSSIPNVFFVEHQVKQKQCYACYHCPYKTAIRASLILHLLVHKKSSEISLLKCELCNFETKWRTSLRTHMLLHKDKSELVIYKCENCKYQSKYKKHLRRHMGTHNKKKLQCDNCAFRSKNLKNFKAHCESYHNVKENKITDSKNVMKVKTGYKCSQCSYETLRFYRIKEHLVKHMNHNETPAYKCDVCHFQTKYKASLSHHKRTHKKKEETRRDQLNQTA